MDGRHEVDTVVVGGGQAGLAMGHQLAQQDRDFVILDAHARVGDAWRTRYGSLRLVTPARMSALPGMAFPGDPHHYPGKDAVADYLEAYAERFDLPVVTGTPVERISRDGGDFDVDMRHGTLAARNVVVATGAFHTPRVPAFAGELDDDVVQVHAKHYRDPDQLADGPVLVVGAGQSGVEIALELAADRDVRLSGRGPGEAPHRGDGGLLDRMVEPIFAFVSSRILVVTNPIGRRVRDSFLDPPRGIPTSRGYRKDVERAGIQRLPRTTGVRDGLPVLEDGTVVDVANVVWATGFAVDYSWIDLDTVPDDRYPEHVRGVVAAEPGLYFLGLMFQHSLRSPLLAGVGEDAAYVAAHMARHRPAEGSAARTGPRAGVTTAAWSSI